MISTPAVAPMRKSLLKKQFPTLLGLIVLIAGLAIGAMVFRGGTSIFLPRATPETTPKSIRISNVTDQGFSVTFMTDEATSGFIRYGTDPKKLTQIGDQRDQLTGSVGEYTLHQISVLRGLEPNTTYYYVLGTGSGSLFDDNGEPFTLKTARQAGTQPKALTVFGSAVTATGSPAAGSVVFVTPPNAGTLSSLVTNTGSWAVSLSTARMKDGSGYAPVAVGDDLSIQVMALNPKDNTQLTAKVEAETAIAIKLGTGAGEQPVKNPTEEVETIATATDPLMTTSTPSAATTSSATSTGKNPKTTNSLSDLVETDTAATSSTTKVTVVDLTDTTSTTPPTVTTGQPTITGKAKPNVKVKIEVNSDNQILTEVDADAEGDFTVDIEALKATLEPGEHTITYTYTDPITGEEVEKTETFFVEADATLAAVDEELEDTSDLLAQATPRPTPFSSANPYPIGTSSATGTKSATTTTPATMTPRPSTRSSSLSTGSGLPTSGSVGTTFLLIGGGMFFLISGLWSWWISRELAQEYGE